MLIISARQNFYIFQESISFADLRKNPFTCQLQKLYSLSIYNLNFVNNFFFGHRPQKVRLHIDTLSIKLNEQNFSFLFNLIYLCLLFVISFFPLLIQIHSACVEYTNVNGTFLFDWRQILINIFFLCLLRSFPLLAISAQFGDLYNLWSNRIGIAYRIFLWPWWPNAHNGPFDIKSI